MACWQPGRRTRGSAQGRTPGCRCSDGDREGRTGGCGARGWPPAAGLVVAVHDDADSRALVEGVLGLVTSLGRMPVVEGVETEDQRRVLEELGCPLLQGFLFARPLTTADTTELLHVGWPSSRVAATVPEQRRQAVRTVTV